MSYKMIIVDDQPKEIDGISGVVSWQRFDIQIVGCMNSAGAAIDFVKAHSVDIVLTDVVMPDMDGFQMIGQIRALRPEIRFIVISCVDTKSFYAKAMQLRVDAYILKPILASEITDAAQKLVTSLGEARENARRKRAAERFHAYAQRKAEEGALIDLVLGRDVDADAAEYFASANWTLPRANTYIAAHLACDYAGAVSGAPWARVLRISADAACVLFAAERRGEDARAQIVACLRPLARETRVGVGVCVTAPEELALSYRHAMEDVRTRLFDTAADNDATAAETVHAIMRCAGDAPFCQNAILEYVSAARSHGDMTLRCAALLAGMRENARFRVLRAEANAETERVYDAVSKIANCRAAAECVTDAFFRLYGSMAAIAVDNADVVERMRGYIDGAFAEEIGLMQVAEHVGLSANYAGSLFKTATGVTIRQYIENARLKKALSIVENTNGVKAAELAAAVGYNNLSYFLKVFKKHYGFTPAAYRRGVSARGAEAADNAMEDQ